MRLRRLLPGLCAGLVLLAGLRLWPHPPLSAQVPGSTAVLDRHGELLRLTLAADGQYQRWVPLADMAPALPEAVLRYEDRRFRWHPGIDPLALARSLWAQATGGRRQGASTISMQLARALYRIDSRNPGGKLRQMLAALWLEARHSKDEILEAYLNTAPYGGNLRGVGAASRVYFGKTPAALTLPEVLTLAVIPQNPRRRLASHVPGSPQQLPPALAAARARLWADWRALHPGDARLEADMRLPLRPRSTGELPFLAPHFTDQVLQTGSGEREIRTTLDRRMQDTLERAVRQYVARHREAGLVNASAMLVDARSRSVRALVGSADYFDAGISGQVNGTRAKRSPGSTLKPFIYALAIDQGRLHPHSMLRDAPTAFGPFSPENFDGRFVGPVSAQDALVRSRNVPAVAVAARLSQPTLYGFLKTAGISRLASESHYGLALTLGGGELSMEELAGLYAMLANGGQHAPLRDREDTPDPAPLRLLSDEAAFVTLDMLRQNPRPDSGAPDPRGVAWKTGTSWGFRDAWTAGVFDGHVLIVWLGHFDGHGDPALVGVRAAAPLFFQIVDSLRGQRLLPPQPPAVPPAGLRKVAVCAESGDLPNAWCPRTVDTWFIPGKSPIRLSTLHRPVYIAADGRAVCGPGPGVRTEVHAFWSSDMLRLFREAGMPRVAPPPLPDCGEGDPDDEEAGPHIASPLRGVTYSLRLSRPVPLALRARHRQQGPLYWFADDSLLGRSAPDEALAWTPPQPGSYTLRVVDAQGRADSRTLQVELLP